MDFFRHQEQARRNTAKLVALFGLAVAGIIAAIYAIAVATLVAVDGAGGRAASWWQPDVLLLATGGTLLVVTAGSLYKIHQLSAGGSAVARLLGGRRVAPNTTDRQEKQLLNVVEEVSIASGVPVPEVWVLERERGINAFAAGLAPGDAVIGVTRGCLGQLTRDELQGVVAHEFSHVLNGDMRLNLRLVGLLHGILCIALAGYVILRSGASFRSRGGKGSAAAGMLVLAIGLVVIGYLGMLFAKLIQAAVSRQREFLADASAVQFTRNPDGLTGALKKIAGYASGSRVSTPQATATSHMFFGNALAPALLGGLATHPPIEERIRRIDRTFRAVQADARAAVRGALAGATAAGAAGFAGAAARRDRSPARLIGQAGQLGDEHLVRTREMLAALPLAVTTALHEPFSARALVYALLLDRDPTRRRAQLGALRDRTDAATSYEAHELAGALESIDGAMRLPLLDLAMPALREMSPSQHDRFARDVRALVHADGKVDLFEFALQKVLLRHLASEFSRPPRTRPRFHSVKPLLDDVQVLLSRLARAGHGAEAAARAAYGRGVAALPSDGYERPLLAEERCDLPAVDRALDRIAQAAPGCKELVLRAGAETVAHDGELCEPEVELLRAIADALDCPIPPVLLDSRQEIGVG